MVQSFLTIYRGNSYYPKPPLIQHKCRNSWTVYQYNTSDDIFPVLNKYEGPSLIWYGALENHSRPRLIWYGALENHSRPRFMIRCIKTLAAGLRLMVRSIRNQLLGLIQGTMQLKKLAGLRFMIRCIKKQDSESWYDVIEN